MKRVMARIQGVEVEVAFDAESVHVYRAFPVKDLLKGRGYRWNPEKKSWFCRGTLDHSLFQFLEPLPEGLAAPGPEPVPGDFPPSRTVGELRLEIEQILKREMGGSFWVRGVISSQVKHYEWASYFEFCDEEGDGRLYFSAEVRQAHLGAIREGLAGTGVAEDLIRDLPLLCQCQVVMGRRGGADLRLQVVRILPEYTRARLRNQMEVTLELLRTEGLLERQRRLTLPRHLWRVGLITSAQGTSVRDVMAGLSPLESRFDILFCDARMEGERAVEAVCRALDRLEHHPHPPQVILLTRGGGSEHALSVFNHPEICRRVARCAIPVLTAIGHEKDHTAVEYCSCHTPTPATPSGLGAWLGRTLTLLFDELDQKTRLLSETARKMRERQEQRLVSSLRLLEDRARQRLLRTRTGLTHQFRLMLEGGRTFRVLRHETLRQMVAKLSALGSLRLEQRQNRLRDLGGQLLSHSARQHHTARTRWLRTMARWDLSRLAGRRKEREKDLCGRGQALLRLGQERLRHAQVRLEDQNRILRAHDPRFVLRRGYALIRTPQGSLLTRKASLEGEQRIHVEFSDGLSEAWIRSAEE